PGDVLTGRLVNRTVAGARKLTARRIPRNRAAKMGALPIQRDKPFGQAGEVKLPVPEAGHAAHLKVIDLARPDRRTKPLDLARPKESQTGQSRLSEDEPCRRPHHLTQKTAAFPLFIGEFF